jgi:hypothetical protein
MAYNPGIVDRSGEILAQSRLAGGMALLGGVSQGIDAFLKKKEEKKNEQEAIAFVKTQFPGIDDAAAKAGIKATGGAGAFIKFKQDMEQTQKSQQAASYAAMLSQGGGQPPPGISRQMLDQLDPQVRLAGENMYLTNAQNRANLEKAQGGAALVQTQLKDQEALAKAISFSTPAGGGELNYEEVGQAFREFGGQNQELVSQLAEQSRKTAWKPETFTLETKAGGQIDVVTTSPNSAQILTPPKTGDNVPAQVKLLQTKLELFKRIPELLRDGKDAEAIAMANALDIKNPFGTMDINFLRSQFKLSEPTENTTGTDAMPKAMSGSGWSVKE